MVTHLNNVIAANVINVQKNKKNSERDTKDSQMKSQKKGQIEMKSSTQKHRKIFVGGLPPDITAQEITDYFEAFGKVCHIYI